MLHHANTYIHRAARLALGVATLGGVGVLGTLSAGSASAADVTATTPLTSSPLFGQGDNPVVGHVYLDDNTVGTNTISAFDRRANGSLTPLAGSPFVAGGAGTGSGLASQGVKHLPKLNRCPKAFTTPDLAAAAAR